MLDFMKANFDKLLLTFLTILAALFVIGSERWHMSGEMVAWAQSLASGFSGALLTLITGSRFVSRSGDNPPPPNGGK